MPDPDKLRVLPRGTALCPDFEKQALGRNAFIGRDCRPIGPETEDVAFDPRGKATRVKVRTAVFVTRVGQPVEVPDRKEYRDAIRDGDLWPADKETAAAVGVKFDPSFGGEHSPEVRQVTEKAAAEMAASVTNPKLAAAQPAKV